MPGFHESTRRARREFRLPVCVYWPPMSLLTTDENLFVSSVASIQNGDVQLSTTTKKQPPLPNKLR